MTNAKWSFILLLGLLGGSAACSSGEFSGAEDGPPKTPINPQTLCPAVVALGGYVAAPPGGGAPVLCICPGGEQLAYDGPCPSGGPEDPRDQAIFEPFVEGLNARKTFDSNLDEAKKFVDTGRATTTFDGTASAATAEQGDGTASGKGEKGKGDKRTDSGLDITGGGGGSGGSGSAPSDGMELGRATTDPAPEEKQKRDRGYDSGGGAVYTGGGAVTAEGRNHGNEESKEVHGRFVDFGDAPADAKTARGSARNGGGGLEPSGDLGARAAPTNQDPGLGELGPMGTDDREDYFSLIPRHGSLFEIISDRYRVETRGWQSEDIPL
ncbi:MAG: hypothetical protein IT285_04500 [Bdellovibrionales bacterium]|nr:hypothetical protein [Bdellovibrionales bacterium]